MSRGQSSQHKNLPPQDSFGSDRSVDGEAIEQTRVSVGAVEAPLALPSSPPKPAVKTRDRSQISAQSVEKLDAAGRLALLQQALIETPQATLKKDEKKRQNARTASQSASNPAGAKRSTAKPRPRSPRLGRDLAASPTPISQQSANDLPQRVEPAFVALPAGSTGSHADDGVDAPALTSSPAGSVAVRRARPVPVFNASSALTLMAARKPPVATRPKAQFAARHDTVGAPNAPASERPAFAYRAPKFNPGARRSILDLEAELTSHPSAFAEPEPAVEQPVPQPQKDTHTQPKRSLAHRMFRSSVASRIIKTIVGLAILVTVGLAPLQRLIQTSSVEAIVNARTITLRAPIDGEIHAESNGMIGKTLAAGDAIFTIENKRADRIRLDDLQRSLSSLREERPVLDERLRSRRALLKDLSEQTRLFLAGRIAQLESRAAEIRAEIGSTGAQRDEAKSAFSRATELTRTQTESTAGLMRAERDYIVANEAVEAAKHRLEGVQVELQAARQGTFIGDSYNDRPHSAQRSDELAQEIAELEATLRAQDSRIDRLNNDVQEETQRNSLIRTAIVSAPGKGRLWEVLTSAGEEVHKGQDLVRLLDCSNAVITAVVSETVYNRLRIGSPARFRFRDDSKEWAGEVVGLTGVAASAANLAILPSALMKESYHVTVAVPTLSNVQNCDVGRTGRVIFDDPVTASQGTTSH
jgi:multidrug resistance efflux pump